MEEENKDLYSRKNFNTFFYILIVETVTVAVVLLSVLVLKFGFKKNYQRFYDWYEENFLIETDIKDIIEETSGESYEI